MTELLKDYLEFIPTTVVLVLVSVVSVVKRVRRRPDKIDWDAFIFFLLAGIATAQFASQLRLNKQVDPIGEVENQLDAQSQHIPRDSYLIDKSKGVIETIKAFKDGYLEMTIDNSLVRENISLANAALRRIDILDVHPTELLRDDYKPLHTALMNAAGRGIDIVHYIIGPKTKACVDVMSKRSTSVHTKAKSIPSHFTEVFIDQDLFRAETEARYVQDDILFLYDGGDMQTTPILLVASPGYSGLERMRISWGTPTGEGSARLSGFDGHDDYKRRSLIEQLRSRLSSSPSDFVVCPR